jgi:predicted ribosome quality control (RQC) complex YloA/Tae2 family protein
MSLTVSEISQWLAETGSMLAGARIAKSYQPASDRLILALKPPGRERVLLALVCTPGLARCHTLEERPANPPDPMGFQMLLRKELDGHRIDEVEQLPGDRILKIRCGNRTLIAELTGRHGNLFLLDEDQRILGSLAPSRSRKRALVSGNPYVPPATTPPDTQETRFLSGQTDAGIRRHYEKADADAALEHTQKELLGRIRAEVRRAKRRVRRIEEDLERAEASEPYWRFGEAIKAGLHQLQKGESEARLPDYHHPEAAEIVVPLDPQRTPQENMERYFKLHRKYRDARAQIEERLQAARKNVERLSDLESRIDEARTLEALAEADSALPRRRSQQRGTQRVGPTLDWREFRSANGRRILVGKDARRNDSLTFRHARGNDLWMHVKEYPGSHVVIPLARDENADQETLLDAATLAVTYSRAPEGAKVEVAYTPVKNVRKPRGAPAGTVIYRGEKTLYLAADPERLQRLRNSDKDGP